MNPLHVLVLRNARCLHADMARAVLARPAQLLVEFDVTPLQAALP